MGRLDWKSGRFDVDYETNEIHDAIRGQQSVRGDEVEWYRFLRENSETHDIYDEGSGVGRVYDGPYRVPVWHVVNVEGLNQNGDTGFYFSDTIHVTASLEALRRLGFERMDVEHHTFLKDRIVYNGKVFRVENIQVLGQVQQRDIIVSIEGAHVRPDEMVHDEQFKQFTI